MSNRRQPTNPMHTNLGNGQVLIDGRFVSQKASDVVEAIMEYDDRFSILYVPQSERVDGQAAYKVNYRPDDGDEYTAFHVQTDEEFDERVLMRIIANDKTKQGVHISDYEAYEQAIMRVRHQEYLDKMEEAQDIAAHVLATRKHKYVVSKDLVIEDGKPFNAAHLDERTGLPMKGSNER